MKQYHILIAFLFFLLLSACTKEDIFLEKPTLTKLVVNTTSATKTFEVWLDDELLQDSVYLGKDLSKSIPAGEHRLRIKQTEETNYFVDTVLNFQWVSQKKYSYSLIETDPNAAPLFFSGFPEDIPAPEKDFVTFTLLNVDKTITKDKKVDILLYSMDDPDILLYEFPDIPYSQLSPYFKVPVDLNNNGGFLVMRDSQNKQLLLDGRNTWVMLYFPFYTPGLSNTFIYKLDNVLDTQNPVYQADRIFEATR